MPAALHCTRIISADSHVMEPLHLWWHALGHKFGDRTPRYLSAYQGRQGHFFYTGYQASKRWWSAVMRPRCFDSGGEHGDAPSVTALGAREMSLALSEASAVRSVR
jgi:hypothetical protein